MRKLLAKLSVLSLTALVVGTFLMPAAFAANCDLDNDGYVSVSQESMEATIVDVKDYNSNGNSDATIWNNWFAQYKTAAALNSALTPDQLCDNLNFKKGMEPSRCDQVIINPASGVYDTSKVSTVEGNKVNPGAFDTPGNGIDENCDGADGKFIADTGTTQDLGGLVQRSLSLLSKAVVVISVMIMIWGGIMYATAAGDENKTTKARKAIIGAVIGLIVGLLAPSIVAYITAQL